MGKDVLCELGEFVWLNVLHQKLGSGYLEQKLKDRDAERSQSRVEFLVENSENFGDQTLSDEVVEVGALRTENFKFRLFVLRDGVLEGFTDFYFV